METLWISFNSLHYRLCSCNGTHIYKHHPNQRNNLRIFCRCTDICKHNSKKAISSFAWQMKKYISTLLSNRTQARWHLIFAMKSAFWKCFHHYFSEMLNSICNSYTQPHCHREGISMKVMKIYLRAAVVHRKRFMYMVRRAHDPHSARACWAS